jgi:hypothetical protein
MSVEVIQNRCYLSADVYDSRTAALKRDTFDVRRSAAEAFERTLTEKRLRLRR